MNDYDLFDKALPPRPPPPPPTLASEGEAHQKLKRNLDLALDVHNQAMRAELPPDLPAGEKRLMVETAHVTVKAALATDRTALRARQENTLEIVMLRILFARKQRGYPIKPEDEERLRTAPRAKLEIALMPREVAEYDQLEW
jgi:hypothetical protein